MWSPKEQLLRLTRSLRSARTVELPKDNEAAARYLMPLVFGNQQKSISDLLENSEFDVNFAFGRVQRTLLQIAANVGSAECLTIFLKHGSNPDYQDISGCTALHLAARNGKHRCVQKLLEFKADPEIRNNEGFTTIHWLAVNGRAEILGDVLPYVKDVDCEDDRGQTALHVASQNGHKSTVQCLLEHNAKVDKADKTGYTALHFACSHGQRHTVPLLLEHGALHIPDQSGETPLNMCLRGGYGPTLQLLLDHFPRLLNTLVPAAAKIMESRYDSVMCCFRNLCSVQKKESILKNISEFTANSGFQLLSVSSDYETQVKCFKSSVELLTVLDEEGNLEVFQSLEVLWSSLEEWMMVLKKEIEEASCKDNTTEDNSDDSPESTTVSTERNILSMTHDRICAIVEGFYLCMQCLNHEKDSTPVRFEDFVTRHHSVINYLIEKDNKIIFKHFSFLLNCPTIMSQFLSVIKKRPFNERYEWFYENLHSKRIKEAEQRIRANMGLPEALKIRRSHVFEDSCEALEKESADSLKYYISVLFQDEEGMGAGVLREWFDVLSNEICNPEYALFTQSDDGSTFQPNCNSAINPDHLNYFSFTGRILGLALYHKQLVNVYFTRSFYKHILGIPVDYTDVASIDPEYAKNLQWILDNDITDLGLDLTFIVETDVFGSMQEIELKPDGANILVTEKNKAEYVQLVTELRMTRAIQPQIDAFREGFNAFIPQSLIQIFTESELELLLSGLSEIDVKDWKNNTKYSGGYSEEHKVVQWFWKSVDSMSSDDRTHLLQFSTGCCRVPHRGFSQLQSASGGKETFVITYLPYQDNDELPTASTCINMLKLPEYPSFEFLDEKLKIAVRCGSQGYAKT
ncbi:E3 ubiquitin-protein ligase HACE1-like [Styela clava]